MKLKELKQLHKLIKSKLLLIKHKPSLTSHLSSNSQSLGFTGSALATHTHTHTHTHIHLFFFYYRSCIHLLIIISCSSLGVYVKPREVSNLLNQFGYFDDSLSLCAVYDMSCVPVYEELTFKCVTLSNTLFKNT